MLLIFAAFPGAEMSKIDVTRTYLEMTSPVIFGAQPIRRMAFGSSGSRPIRWACSDSCTPRWGSNSTGATGWSGATARLRNISKGRSGPGSFMRGRPGGYFELKRHEDGSVEIAYFGLMPHAIGRGLGTLLLTKAVEEAWNLSPTRVWLHTCTLDHPAALPNYVKRGFSPFRTEVYQTTIP